MTTLAREIKLHQKIHREYDKRYSPAFAQVYLKWWDNLITQPIQNLKTDYLLDCGCGQGDLSRKLARQKKESLIVGLDASREMIKVSRLPSNLFFVVGDANRLPFENQAFNALVCKEALHHFEKPEKALVEFSRVLRAGGKLMLSDPCNDSILLRYLRKISFLLMRKFSPDHGSFKLKQMKAMLSRAGFKIIRQYRVGYLAYPLCGLADILPFLSFMPFSVLITKFLIRLDIFLSRLPGVQLNNWLVVTHAEKKN